MARYESKEMELEAVRSIAALMVSSARTAPKARAIDNIKVALIDGEDLNTLAKAMEEQGVKHAGGFQSAFARDAANLRQSAGCLLIGCDGIPKGYPGQIEIPLNCGACGYGECRNLDRARLREGMDFSGPVCVIQAIDLGIAIGSAAKLASSLNADNRIMYTVGAAARQLGLLEADIIMGIPLSVSGKSPYFDRRAATISKSQTAPARR